jgi:hypothetical protein
VIQAFLLLARSAYCQAFQEGGLLRWALNHYSEGEPEMDDDTFITWGQLKRAVERASQTAEGYSESRDPHEEIAQVTASMALAHLESALDEERQSAELAEELKET